MFWTILGVAIVTLLVLSAAWWLRKNNRTVGTGALALVAVVWAFVRLVFIQNDWTLIRPLEVGWFLLVLVLAGISLVVDLWLQRESRVFDWIAFAVAILAPFGDLVGRSTWTWPATAWIIVFLLAVVCVALVVLKAIKPAVVAGVAAIFLVVGVLGSILVANNGHGGSAQIRKTPSTEVIPPHPSGTPLAAACKSTWPMAAQTPLNGNWVAQGVPSIKEAKTKAEAKAAAMDWLNKIKDMPGTLQGASAYLLNKQVGLSSLRDGDGCATAKAESLVNELSVALAASDISPGQAPTNGYNSGTKSGSTYTYSLAGVSGDRSAIKVEVAGKRAVWIMYRCGNAVTHRPPTPTKPHHPTPVCTSNCHPCPPGQWRNPKGICLQPKSTNPKDYTYPSGKPPVKAHGPAESRPPKVKTSEKGGGGVTDTPTNHPGSATGGKAPGTGSSTSRPTPTQSPATGSNDGSGGTISNPF